METDQIKDIDPDNIIKPEVVISNIEILKKADISNISIQKMTAILLNELGMIPFCEGNVHEGALILRSRLNFGEELFYSEKDLSYRPDFYNIKDYGRASAPLRSVFYGTVVTNNATEAISTILAETSELYRNSKYIESDVFFCTIGFWRAIEPIKIAEMLFTKKFKETIEYAKHGYEHYMQNFRGKLPEDKVRSIEVLLEFLSDEFAKSNIRTNSDYIISASYSQWLLETQQVSGILYPSVRSDVGGINIAMYPNHVELYFKFLKAFYCKVEIKEGIRRIYPLKETADSGPYNSLFSWKDVPID